MHHTETISISLTSEDWQYSRGALDRVLMCALERSTLTSWRAVCPNVIVEGVEPYRTLVLNNEILQFMREWGQHCETNEESSERKSSERSGNPSADVSPLAGLIGQSKENSIATQAYFGQACGQDSASRVLWLCANLHKPLVCDEIF